MTLQKFKGLVSKSHAKIKVPCVCSLKKTTLELATHCFQSQKNFFTSTVPTKLVVTLDALDWTIPSSGQES